MPMNWERLRLTDYRFRGHSYDVSMNRYGFDLSRDGKKLGSYDHGQSVRIWPDGRFMTHKEMRVSIPITDTENFVFVDTEAGCIKISFNRSLDLLYIGWQ